MEKEQKEKLIKFIEEEYQRIKFGKIIIELSVHRGKCAILTMETKRSVNLQDNVL